MDDQSRREFIKKALKGAIFAGGAIAFAPVATKHASGGNHTDCVPHLDHSDHIDHPDHNDHFDNCSHIDHEDHGDHSDYEDHGDCVERDPCYYDHYDNGHHGDHSDCA